MKTTRLTAKRLIAAGTYKRKQIAAVAVELESGRTVEFVLTVGLTAANDVYLEVDDLSQPTGKAKTLRFNSRLLPTLRK